MLLEHLHQLLIFTHFTQAFCWLSFYAVNLRWNCTLGPRLLKDFSPPIYRVIGYFPRSDVNNFMKCAPLNFQSGRKSGGGEVVGETRRPPNAAHHFQYGRVAFSPREPFGVKYTT